MPWSRSVTVALGVASLWTCLEIQRAECFLNQRVGRIWESLSMASSDYLGLSRIHFYHGYDRPRRCFRSFLLVSSERILGQLSSLQGTETPPPKRAAPFFVSLPNQQQKGLPCKKDTVHVSALLASVPHAPKVPARFHPEQGSTAEGRATRWLRRGQ